MQHLTHAETKQQKRSRLLTRGAVIALVAAVVTLGGCQALGIGPTDGDGGDTATAPAAPTGLSASAVSASEIELTWSDESGNETGFEIQSRQGTSGDYSDLTTTGADVESHTDTGLSASTTYSYRIRAVNDAGTSDWVNGASASTSGSTSGSTYSFTVTDPNTGNGVSGVYVFINDPSDGSLIASTQTDSSGEVTFSDVSPTPVTLSFAREDQDGDGMVQSVVNVSPGSYTIPVQVTQPSESSTDVAISLTDTPNGYVHGSLLPVKPGGSVDPDFENASSGQVTVDGSQLDNQGEFNAVVVALDSDYLPISYGVLSDQALNEGDTYNVSVDVHSPVPEYSFSTNQDVNDFSVQAVHDGTVYSISENKTFTSTQSGTLLVYDQFPVDPSNGDEYLVTALGQDTTSSGVTGFAFQPSLDSLPSSSEFDLSVPDYTLSSLSYDASTGTASWSVSGSGSVSLIGTLLAQSPENNPSYEWIHLGTAESTSTDFPDLPSAISGWFNDPTGVGTFAFDLRDISDLADFRDTYLGGSGDAALELGGGPDLRFRYQISKSLQQPQ